MLSLNPSSSNKTDCFWEVVVGQEKFELSEKAYEQLLESEKKKVQFVTIGDKMININYIQSARKVYRDNDLFQPTWLHEKIEPMTEGQQEKINKIKEDIRAMLKKKNLNQAIRRVETPEDVAKREAKEQREQAIKTVCDTLKSELQDSKFPHEGDRRWVANNDIKSHTEGRNRHSVDAKIMNIDINAGEFIDVFFSEAEMIFCSVCNKHILKKIFLYNNHTSTCLYKDFLDTPPQAQKGI